MGDDHPRWNHAGGIFSTCCDHISSVCSVQCELSSMVCVVCNFFLLSQCPVSSVYCTFSVCGVECTVCIVQCVMCNVQCVMYSV